MLRNAPASLSVLVVAGMSRRMSKGGRSTTSWHGASPDGTTTGGMGRSRAAEQLERQPVRSRPQQQRRAQAAGEHAGDARASRSP